MSNNNRRMSINDMHNDRQYFFNCFDNYIYDLAKRQDFAELENLFTRMPFLLAHAEYRPLIKESESHQKQWLSLPWAIFCEQDTHTSKAHECLLMLKRVGFEPDGHFYDRLFRNGGLFMIKDFCQIFDIDSSHVNKNQPPLSSHPLSYAAFNIDSPDGMAIFKHLLDLATDVDAACGARQANVLFDLFISPGVSPDTPDRLSKTLLAINWVLEKGASTSVSGMLNAYEHNYGKGEVFPLLHAIYWCAHQKNRICAEIVQLAERVCDPDLRDSNGRNAQEYRQFLIDRE